MWKVLVVDDEESIRALVSATLEDSGYNVRESDSGQDALSAIKTFHPDVIISDINMPGMTGFDLLENVRKDEATSDIPFIFITGVGGKQVYRHGMDLGADDFLEKPFSKADLLASLKTRLSMKQVQHDVSNRKLQDLRSSIALTLPHEFRTPLNAVLAFSRILRDDEGISPEEVRKFSGMIHTAGERLHHLAENYLLYAQINVVRADGELLADMRSTVAEQAHKHIHSAAREVADNCHRGKDLSVTLEPATILISPEHLAKCIRELTDNAMKFSEPDSKVTITGRADGGKYRVQVADSGRGMTPDNIRSIDVLQQFNRQKMEQQGTGFGLGIVKRLTEMYDGTFGVQSSPEQGTVVTLTFRTGQ